MSVQTQLDRLERAVDNLPGDGNNDGRVAVVVDPDWFGNRNRLPNSPPAHECTRWYGTGHCNVCEQFEAEHG